MSDSQLPSEKKSPAWPATTLAQRLIDCRIMLYVHGILTDAEKDKADRRIDQYIRKGSTRG
jgi:hypothetical protein